MVANLMFPRVSTSGSSAGVSEVSPLHPNHTPPVCRRAARTPTARPPGAAPRRGSAIRLETQTRRLTRKITAVAPECSGGRLPGLEPAHAGAETQSPHLPGGHIQWLYPYAGIREEVLDHSEHDFERFL